MMFDIIGAILEERRKKRLIRLLRVMKDETVMEAMECSCVAGVLREQGFRRGLERFMMLLRYRLKEAKFLMSTPYDRPTISDNGRIYPGMDDAYGLTVKVSAMELHSLFGNPRVPRADNVTEGEIIDQNLRNI